MTIGTTSRSRISEIYQNALYRQPRAEASAIEEEAKSLDHFIFRKYSAKIYLFRRNQVWDTWQVMYNLPCCKKCLSGLPLTDNWSFTAFLASVMARTLDSKRSFWCSRELQLAENKKTLFYLIYFDLFLFLLLHLKLQTGSVSSHSHSSDFFDLKLSWRIESALIWESSYLTWDS